MKTKETLETFWTDALWQQFGAAMKMLDNALQACPDSLWRERLWSAPPDDPQSPRGEVWRTAYHTLYWLDLYLSSIADAPGVTPPSPFPAPSLDAEDDEPERPYTKEEVRAYLAYTAQKCQRIIATLSGERARYPYEFPWEKGQGRPMSYGELMLYVLRHTQEHAAQLSLFLGRRGIPDEDLDWVMRATSEG
jgi:uncharacterized damage-inducible protein DinB